MSVGLFTMQEVRRVGGATVEGSPGNNEAFTWTSDSRPPGTGEAGGARACPRNSWMMTGRLRTIRTDYPGASIPSEQVLGPNHDPFTLSGRFDDRYNFPGYALQEMRRFEAMCRRGNILKVQFQNQAFEGLITEWKFNYKREWYVEYTFTMSVHSRPDEEQVDVSPKVPPTPTDIADASKIAAEAMKEVTTLVAPRDLFAGSEMSDTIDARLLELDLELEKIDDTIDGTLLSDSSGTDRFFNGYKRLATQFRDTRSTALGIITAMTETRSDTELAVRTALSVLDYESWTRSMRFNARVLMGQAQKGADEMDERDEPAVQRVYRPFKGESLYAISRKFYGTPHAWRFISDRNGLRDFELQGDEVLIIPNRGEGG